MNRENRPALRKEERQEVIISGHMEYITFRPCSLKNDEDAAQKTPAFKSRHMSRDRNVRRKFSRDCSEEALNTEVPGSRLPQQVCDLDLMRRSVRRNFSSHEKCS